MCPVRRISGTYTIPHPNPSVSIRAPASDSCQHSYTQEQNRTTTPVHSSFGPMRGMHEAIQLLFGELLLLGLTDIVRIQRNQWVCFRLLASQSRTSTTMDVLSLSSRMGALDMLFRRGGREGCRGAATVSALPRDVGIMDF